MGKRVEWLKRLKKRRAIVQAQRRLREFPLAQVTRKLLVELRKEEVRRDKARRQAATCAGRGEPKTR